jgi:hypothetical protein
MLRSSQPNAENKDFDDETAITNSAVEGSEERESIIGDIVETELHEALIGLEFDMLILDEAHYIRHPESGYHQFAASIPSQVIVLMTATPLMNKVDDFAGYANLFWAKFDYVYGVGWTDTEADRVYRKYGTLLLSFTADPGEVGFWQDPLLTKFKPAYDMYGVRGWTMNPELLSRVAEKEKWSPEFCAKTLREIINQVELCRGMFTPNRVPGLATKEDPEPEDMVIYPGAALPPCREYQVILRGGRAPEMMQVDSFCDKGKKLLYHQQQDEATPRYNMRGAREKVSLTKMDAGVMRAMRAVTADPRAIRIFEGLPTKGDFVLESHTILDEAVKEHKIDLPSLSKEQLASVSRSIRENELTLKLGSEHINKTIKDNLHRGSEEYMGLCSVDADYPVPLGNHAELAHWYIRGSPTIAATVKFVLESYFENRKILIFADNPIICE